MKKLILSVFLSALMLPLVAQITGSGTENYIPKFTKPSSIGNSIIFQNSDNYIGIGLDKPLTKLHINGNLQIGGSISKVALGSAYGESTGWGIGYLGFNARRNLDNSWSIDGDGEGGNNGAAIIYGNVAGDIIFSPFASTSGFSVSKTDKDINENPYNIKFSRTGDIGIGVRNPIAKLNIANDVTTDRKPSIDVTHLTAGGGIMHDLYVDKTRVGIGISGDIENLPNPFKYSSLVVGDMISIVQGDKTSLMMYPGVFLFAGVESFQFKNYGTDTYLPITTGGLTLVNDYGMNKAMINNKGGIWCQEVIVQYDNPWADFVFDESYKMMTLPELESFIIKNKHLPEIPSAKEIETTGINLGEMDAKLLQKIEELSLYIIDLQKRINALENQK